MTATPKVAGTQPGELLRDLADPRLLAAHPRPDGMDDATYLKRLEAQGLALVLPRERVAAGEYARAKAQAIVNGAVVLVPYDEYERRPAEAFGDANASEPFDYAKWRADYDRAEREGRSPYDAAR